MQVLFKAPPELVVPCTRVAYKTANTIINKMITKEIIKIVKPNPILRFRNRIFYIRIFSNNFSQSLKMQPVMSSNKYVDPATFRVNQTVHKMLQDRGFTIPANRRNRNIREAAAKFNTSSDISFEDYVSGYYFDYTQPNNIKAVYVRYVTSSGSIAKEDIDSFLLQLKYEVTIPENPSVASTATLAAVPLPSVPSFSTTTSVPPAQVSVSLTSLTPLASLAPLVPATPLKPLVPGLPAPVSVPIPAGVTSSQNPFALPTQQTNGTGASTIAVASSANRIGSSATAVVGQKVIVSAAILITNGELSTQAKAPLQQQITSVENKSNVQTLKLVQHFVYGDLMYNCTQNVYGVKYELVPVEEVKDELKKMQLTFRQPMLFKSDSAEVKYYGWPKGSLVRILRTNLLPGVARSEINYRIVV